LATPTTKHTENRAEKTGEALETTKEELLRIDSNSIFLSVRVVPHRIHSSETAVREPSAPLGPPSNFNKSSNNLATCMQKRPLVSLYESDELLKANWPIISPMPSVCILQTHSQTHCIPASSVDRECALLICSGSSRLTHIKVAQMLEILGRSNTQRRAGIAFFCPHAAAALPNLPPER
jgi:hypothetical protein